MNWSKNFKIGVTNTMTNYTPIVFLHNLKKQNGGLHKAIYHRVNLLSEKYERVIIFTFGFDIEFKELCEYHKRIGNINPNIEIINIYEQRKENNKMKLFKKNNNHTYIKDEKNHNSYRVFNNKGEYEFYVRLRDNGAPQFKDFFKTPWNRYMKEIYDKYGNLRKRIFMDSDNKPSYSVIFSTEENPMVSSVLNKVDYSTNNFFNFSLERQFDNDIQMAVECLKELLKGIDFPLLFIDKREYVKYFNNISGDNITKVFTLHSNHLDYPYNDIEIFSPSVSDLFSALRENMIDNLIVLTNNQKKDIQMIEKIDERITVIPHYQPKILSEVLDKKDNLIVTLARYHNAKNLNAAIKVIEKVKKTIPDIKFCIYGYGPQEQMLKNLIEELNLTENIFLMGHTNNPLEKVKEVKLSLMTSNYEGFNLAIAEAMACSTPVVSYNTKYGPGDLIRNGIDGFLVEDINQAAEKVIEILKLSESEYKKLQEKALEVTDRFSEHKINKLWLDFIESLTK